MAYATAATVAGLIAQFTIDGSSKPNSTQLATIISEVDAELNTVLSAQGVSVPVTTPAYFLTWLEGVSSAGCAARALKSMFPNTTGAMEIPAYAFWQKIYSDSIAGLKSGDLIPPDVTAGVRVTPSTYFNRNPDEEEDLGVIAEPFFKRGTNF